MDTGFEPPALPPKLPPIIIMEGGQYVFGGGVGNSIDNNNNSGAPSAPAHHPQLPPPQQQQQQQIIAPDNNQATLSRRQKAARGALAKIDSVYGSVHALEILANLIKDACYYIETISREDFKQNNVKKRGKCVDDIIWKQKGTLDLPCECLRLAIDELDQHGSIISTAIVNSSDTKEVKYAQHKLMKSQKQKQNYAQWGANHSGIMERDPRNALAQSLTYAKETLGDILSKTDRDFIDPTRAKKRKKCMEQAPSSDTVDNAAGNAEVAAKAEGGNKKQKSDPAVKLDEVAFNSSGSGEQSKESTQIIELPLPREGQHMYSPLETVAYIMNMMENNPGKSYVRIYKEKMMEKRLIPIRKSQLNSLVKHYGGLDKPVAPLNWNERGARELGWEVLLTQFRHKQNKGMSWSINDTRDALNNVAMTSKKKAPKWETIESHHATLIQLHKQQNHINVQIVIQERRLNDQMPVITVQKYEKTKGSPKPLKFNKNDKKYRKIKLPKPAVGNMIYTPAEAIANIMIFSESKPKPSRTEVRAFKEKMIAEKLIPISISQLNFLVQRHSGPDKPPAPKCWNAKGREDIMSIEDLCQTVNDSQMMWSIDDTCGVLWESKKKQSTRAESGKSPDEVKRPDKKTVNAYHTALLSMPSVAHKVIKPEVVKLKPGPKSNKQLVTAI